MIIRQEKTEDFAQIYDLVKTAFETAEVSNGDEQNFVNKLRASDNYIPELALVAEENGKLIGHIMLTKTYIENNDNKLETLYLAPVSVLLEHRKQGIGANLIKNSFKLATDMGYKSVVLVGNPNYYSRFGFKKSTDFGIKNVNDIPDEYVMACELTQGGLSEIKGTINFF